MYSIFIGEDDTGLAEPETTPVVQPETTPVVTPDPSQQFVITEEQATTFCDLVKRQYMATYLADTDRIQVPDTVTQDWIKKLTLCKDVFGETYDPVNYLVWVAQRKRLEDYGGFTTVPILILTLAFTGIVVANRAGAFDKIKVMFKKKKK